MRVACSGGSPERARAEAARLAAEGATGLVSFGLAGGLAPELRPGDLVLPETVQAPDGRSLPTDPAWRDNLLFFEYFHGDLGCGLGAMHQTGWTALVVDLLLDRPDLTFRGRALG